MTTLQAFKYHAVQLKEKKQVYKQKEESRGKQEQYLQVVVERPPPYVMEQKTVSNQ